MLEIDTQCVFQVTVDQRPDGTTGNSHDHNSRPYFGKTTQPLTTQRENSWPHQGVGHAEQCYKNVGGNSRGEYGNGGKCDSYQCTDPKSRLLRDQSRNRCDTDEVAYQHTPQRKSGAVFHKE